MSSLVRPKLFVRYGRGIARARNSISLRGSLTSSVVMTIFSTEQRYRSQRTCVCWRIRKTLPAGIERRISGTCARRVLGDGYRFWPYLFAQFKSHSRLHPNAEKNINFQDCTIINVKIPLTKWHAPGAVDVHPRRSPPETNL